LMKNYHLLPSEHAPAMQKQTHPLRFR
jgi:hypothetical protein